MLWTRNQKAQFSIDIAFGVLFLAPLVYSLYDAMNPLAVTFSIGAGSAYALHVTQKMIVFNELMESEVEERVEAAAESKVSDQVEEQANEIEKKAEEKAEETVEKQVEEKVVEISDEIVENGDSE